MELIALPALSDNYIWLLHNGTQALAVDPGQAQPVQNALQAHGLELACILVTHHHTDHTGGVAALRAATGAAVFGPAHAAMPAAVPLSRVADGSRVRALGLCFEVLDVPGHTSGDVAYFCADVDGAGLLFSGDTLFSAGCGRVFEGTPAQMLAALDRLAALPGHTRVCCAHEYTLDNLRFALAVEPGNSALAAHLRHCEPLRQQGKPTLPSTIALERAINPFLRSRQASVAQAVCAHAPPGSIQTTDEVAVFAALREWKNNFK
ncbi:MAG: hydroxyacylglutathione hydrolase [Burkholderiaceae bacterium]|jgi:hydroxyacylglutathione hydrolase|nr:hydroxyacylglutathione hydrolase [Burkholderiaceae bacterium]